MQIMSLFAAVVLVVLLFSPWEPTNTLASAAAAAAASVAARRYDSIFALGDSFTDTGNNPVVFNYYSIADPVTRPPYGDTFFGRPTGRNCDGRLIIDFIAEGLGLPYVPPYLGPPFGHPTPDGESFRRGASMAVGGATALDVDFYHSRGILPASSNFPLNASLNVQLDWFESNLKPSLCGTTQDCEAFFGRSLFFVGEFGVNDYQFLFGKRTVPDISSNIVPTIVDTISQAIERLIKLGAKTLVVPGVIPSGCTPVILDIFPEPKLSGYDPKTGCMLRYNELGRHHNTLLQESLQQIRAKNPGVKVIYADFFGPIMEMVRSPRNFGFRKDILTVCCGGGSGNKYNYNMSAPCGSPNSTTCSYPSTSLNWDGIHFTEAANRRIASNWLSSITSGGRSGRRS